MDNFKNHLASEDLARTTFEYTFPTTDGDDTESNKSTPYFTPLEFFQSSFEFPSPTLDKTAQNKTILNSDIDSSSTSPATSGNVGYETPRAVDYQSIDNNKKPSTPKTFAAVNPKQMPSTSPALHRKLRRFSLYERRSCSPQHLLLRNSSSSMESNSIPTTDVVDDKENTKPRMTERSRDESVQFVTQSGNNSPITLVEDTNSPNIMTVNETRLTYSPKLLASINNLNLGGSPLGVISSAGYKNGNYFKFPEVDHVVQESTAHAQGEESSAHRDNHLQNRQNQSVCIYLANPLPAIPSTHHKARLKSNNQNEENADKSENSKLSTRADKKNRKNKNNLTIKISDTNSAHFARKSPSPKPKTPTIKSTKEKALSLDSAAGASELSLTVYNRDQTCVSCDEIDSQDLQLASNQLKHSGTTVSHELLRPETVTGCDPQSNRSTSLSQLPSLSTDASNFYSSSSTIYNKTTNIVKTSRRKIPTTANNEWLHYHRKQNPFNKRTDIAVLKGVCSKKVAPDLDSCDKSKPDDSICGEKFFPKHIQSSSNNSQSTLAPSLRGLHKHNPLLHASNTNLKTLPEFLTLVEFTNTSLTQQKDTEYPFKQKSFDLPSSSAASQAHNPPNLRTKTISSNSATNLLQRRGSNHSLTLNLHGSCSNLLGSCRSGLSVSNYSLGSAANSTTNLNSKSSYNLDLSATSNAQTLNIVNPSKAMPQGVKQSLFRRRGSNNSLTLQLSANSCGNLNSFCSQNSLNIEGHQLMPSTGVTRTTSFVTPTKNTASSSITQKRGLLERRGSNQSLTLNMGSSFGGTGIIDRNNYAAGSTEEIDPSKRQHDCSQRPAAKFTKNLLPIACSQSHQRKFFSSENLTKANTQFSDLNHAHKRNSQQVCFGSVSDLKPSGTTTEDSTAAEVNFKTSLSREQLDFQDSTVCSCTGVRNITTRPLSPQTTSEEFKIYLANIQMLQNASNALNQFDLIKLNYIFDNSYALASSKSISILSTIANKGSDSPPGLLTTSEDCEVADRYQQAVHSTLATIKLEDDEQKRMFRELHKEFWDLPLNHQEKPMVFGSQTKNRYKTILPNENSRVILENEWKCVMRELKSVPSAEMNHPKALLDDCTTQYVVSKEAPYINANYIKGPDFNSKCYVATQGPLPNTIFEFWLMVYQNTKKHLELAQLSGNAPAPQTAQQLQQYHQKIVMLTNFIENQRQKCSVYFPIELNELFIAADGQETQNGGKDIEKFFQEYLTASNDEDDIRITHNHSNDQITFTQIDLPADLHKHLPRDTNYFIIKNVGIVRKNGFSIRKFSILYCINMPTTSSAEPSTLQLLLRKFYCYHYWYPDWPDHRSPKDINTLLDICLHILNLGKCEQEFESFRDQVPSPQQCTDTQQVDQYQQDIFNDAQPLPVIHCSAGIGRTGCLVAILNGVRQLRQSLAFSLISMASAVSKHESSPVDFRLPTQYMQQFEENIVISPTDTDSGFTRNTLLYVSYILRKQCSSTSADEQNSNDEAIKQTSNEIENVSSRKSFGQSWLPALNELPKMPDVYVDVLGIVCNLRLQRGGMVQNSEQYELIHRAICLYLKRTFALKRF